MTGEYNQDFYITKKVNVADVANHIARRIKELPNDKRWHIRIKPLYNKRSAEQNAYYWSAVVPVVCQWHRESTGENVPPDVIHDLLIKPTYCPYTTEIFNGVEVKIHLTTTQLKTWQFNDMIDHIVADFAELGYVILPPDPNWKKNERRPKGEAA